MKIAIDAILKSWNVICMMAPYLLLGFFVAGVLGAFLPISFIEKHLGKRGFRQIVKAALLGVPIPLCSCGIIPLSVSLRKHGATQGATLSFLTSTPQTGMDSIAATWGLLGPFFALFRTGIAFVTGCLCGVAVEGFSLLIEKTGNRCQDTHCPTCHPAPKTLRWKQVFTYGFGTLPRDISRALLFGILLSGLLGAFVPDDFFTHVLHSEWLSMLAVMGLGIPLYVCSTGSIPVALAMVNMGLSPGAALVFLITGPATNAATIATVFTTMGRRVTAIYLITLAGCSLAAGWLLNGILSTEQIVEKITQHADEAGIFHQICALFLMGILFVAILSKRKIQKKKS